MVYPDSKLDITCLFINIFCLSTFILDLLFMPFQFAVTSSLKSTNFFAITYMLLLSSFRLLKRVTVGLFSINQRFLMIFCNLGFIGHFASLSFQQRFS